MKRYELYEKYIGTGESIADTRLAQDGEWVAYADYKQALAEKDREIARLTAQQDKLTEDLATTKAWKDDWKLEVIAHHKTQEEYNTLMAQAVRFAECVYELTNDRAEVYRMAQASLKERENDAKG